MKTQKTALVTGASKGIGRAIAIKLAKEGYYTYFTYYTDKSGAEETLKLIFENAGIGEAICSDARLEKDTINLVNTIKQKHTHIDVFVSNAVRDVSKTIEDSSFDEWKLAIDTKLHGLWLGVKYFLPLLKQSEDANIIVISSNADEKPPAEVLSYATATGATNTLFKALVPYLAKYKIRINAIMPGEVRTANWQSLQCDDEFWEILVSKNPLGRVATVEDVADAIMIPINDEHKFLNGNCIFVNGGSHLM